MVSLHHKGPEYARQPCHRCAEHPVGGSPHDGSLGTLPLAPESRLAERRGLEGGASPLSQGRRPIEFFTLVCWPYSRVSFTLSVVKNSMTSPGFTSL